MSIFHESGVSVDLTDLCHHRFCDLPSYTEISGDHIREFDYCWLQEEAIGNIAANTLIGLELKGYEQTKIPVDKLFDNLVGKIRDTVSLFSAAWLQQGLGAQLHTELPESYRTFSPLRKFKLVILVNIQNNQAMALKAVREKLKNRIRGIEKLHGITVTLCNLDLAHEIGLPVSRSWSL